MASQPSANGGEPSPQTTTNPSPLLPPAIPLPQKADVIAPDGSEVRILASTPRASMANFRLAAGQMTIGVVHRTVDEVWMCTGGRGAIWWCPAGGRPELAGVEDVLVPGVSVSLPVGTHFQFRAAEDGVLDFLGVTVPPWPGEGEAVVSGLAPWEATVGPAGGDVEGKEGMLRG